ncbi:MAG TPA: hypothetical protein VL098_02940 [Flavipsychrobacter sp.]|nr:hypothetical protein [Flavipsychrobacter sp.]
MSILAEVADGIKMVAEAIKNIRDIHEGIKDGKSYFEKSHPEIRKDVAAMCMEMSKTCNAISTASALLTHYRFNASPGVIDSEPTRFNDYFIRYKTDQQEAEKLILSLKGHCSIIRDHAEKIGQGSISHFWSLLGFQSQQRQNELQALLQKIYDDERDFHNIVYKMARSLGLAVEDITEELSENGMLHSSKVPDAAAKLAAYSQVFKELEKLAATSRDELEKTIQSMT